jgi:hypothetical protein
LQALFLVRFLVVVHQAVSMQGISGQKRPKIQLPATPALILFAALRPASLKRGAEGKNGLHCPALVGGAAKNIENNPVFRGMILRRSD